MLGMPHVVLLGDSILDNRAYIGSAEPDVIQQLRQRLPHGWSATLLAVDGSVTEDVGRQLVQIPEEATHLVVSVGGNDALGEMAVLQESATSVAEAMARFVAIQAKFEWVYQRMLDVVSARDLPLAICTIYNGAFPDAAFQQLATLGAAIFDDVILRAATMRRLPALDLRLVCTEPSDFANPIEPSASGGAKIARAIAALLAQHDFSRPRAQIYSLSTQQD
jgi:hypothetical protein